MKYGDFSVKEKLVFCQISSQDQHCHNQKYYWTSNNGLGREEGYGVYHQCQQYFTYIVAVSFIDGVEWSTKRKPPTCHKSVTNFVT